MGMSTSVVGVRELNGGLFDKMVKVKLACEDARIGYPKEVKEYFGKNYDATVELIRQEMEEVDMTHHLTRINKDSVDGWEVDLSKLPIEIKAIRFRNSY